ncbi:MAG: TlpA disulfide reductase family protein [Patescibacteria group bacterium]|nr:TlpA disulfide reductase family protein [Patescibacteria group bacterium]
MSAIIVGLLLMFGCGSENQNLPVRGKSFTINYNPSQSGILEDLKSITVVYAFDYWGTKGSAKYGKESLFLNVKNPDSGRAFKSVMKKSKQEWTTSIDIPKDVELLSYYFTDGEKFDYNNKKTFVLYITNSKGEIIKNSRFRNIAFLAMAGEDMQTQIKEAEEEISHYPKSWLVYIALWEKKFNTAETMSEIIQLRKDADKQYLSLISKYGERDSIKTIKAGWLFNYERGVGSVVNKQRISARKEFMEVMESIPAENRFGTTEAYFNRLKKYEKMRNEGAKFNKNIIGNPAPDFRFATLDGKSKKLSDFQGNFVLLDFWGTWCGPCVGEIPNLKKAYKKYHDQGFEIISISSDARSGMTEQELKKWVSEKDMKWKQVMDKKDARIQKLYKINKYPTLFLINPEGKVIKVDTGLRGETLDKILDSIYNKN